MPIQRVIACATYCLLSACASTSYVDLGEDTDAFEPNFQWPVHGASLTQKFRPKKASPFRRKHQGVDLAAVKGTPIYAAEHGYVRYVGTGINGYGRLVIIEHADTRYRSYYAHLEKYKVKRGDVVRKGQLVGLMGNSGRSTGVHLHFEIRRDRLAVNPLEYLPTSTATAQQANP